MLFKTLLVAGTASASCLHGIHRRAEGAVEVSQFGYEGDFGPLNWAALAPENEACGRGSNQSPINIDSSITLATEKPVLDIPEQTVEFENLNTTIEVIVNGTTTFGGNQFQLAQYHIHTPSEHRINREFFPLEVHMVHTGVADPSQIAVLALMFEMSANVSDPIIAGITPHLADIEEPGSKTEIERIDFSGVMARVASSDIFQYSGSLTTPPCSEGVTFLAVKDPLPINVADFNAIKKVVKFNSRLSQNSLGLDNIIAVGAASTSAGTGGTPTVGNVTTASDNSTANAHAESACAGSIVLVNSMNGTPLPTPVLGCSSSTI